MATVSWPFTTTKNLVRSYVKSWLKFANSMVDTEEEVKDQKCGGQVVSEIAAKFPLDLTRLKWFPQAEAPFAMRRIMDCTEPDDDSPVPLEFFQRSHSQTSDTRELVISVYRAVWDEFYAWEKHESNTMIASHARRPAHDPADHLKPGALGFQKEVAIDGHSDSSHSYFLVTEYDKTGRQTSSRIPSVSIPFQSTLDPHPLYQVCTPIARNIFWRPGDPDDGSYAPFIPYADEQKFDQIEYLEQFEAPNGYPELEWQQIVDPDRKFLYIFLFHLTNHHIQ
jgi:hypothetical protein